jgi:hypothetical protein
MWDGNGMEDLHYISNLKGPYILSQELRFKLMEKQRYCLL